MDFSDLLNATPVGDDMYRVALGKGRGFLYGGASMCLAVTAAGMTVPDDMILKSLRTSFLTAGAWAPTDLAVERVNTGRSFALRRVKASQQQRTVTVSDLSFHRPEDGIDRQGTEMPAVPGPDGLAPIPTLVSNAKWLELRPAWGSDQMAGRIHPYWARIQEDFGSAATAHAAALAFMSDYMVVHSPFEPDANEAHGMSSLTLDHALWVHRPFRADDWLLFDATPVSRSSGRFVSRGAIYDRHGTLVASFMQEGVTRARATGDDNRGMADEQRRPAQAR